MAATISTHEIGALLKEFFLGPVHEQLNRETIALDLFEKARVTWAGRVAIVPVHVGATGGAVSFSDAGTVPAARMQDFEKMSVEARRLLARFQVDGMIMAAAAKGNGDQVINWMEGSMDALVSDVRDTMNQHVFSGGTCVGFIGQRKNEVAAADWDFFGDLTKAGGATTVNVVRMDTYASVSAGLAVNSIDAAAQTINLNALNTDGLPDGVCCALLIDAAAEVLAADQEPTGIYGAIGKITYFTVSRAAGAVPALRSNVLDQANDANGNRTALTLSRLQAAIDTVLTESGEDVDTIFMHPLQRQSYTALLTANIQVQGDKAGRGDGGFTGLSYGGVEIRTSRACGRGGLVLMTLKHWKVLELEKGGFADFDGSSLSRVANADAAEGYYKHYYNTVCSRPNAQAVLIGLSI